MIGINSSIASLSGGQSFGGSSQSGSIGLGFAIPINEAKTISQQIISTGTVKHPFLGVSLRGRQRRPGQRRARGRRSSSRSRSGTPAASAGLKKGDAVVAIDSDPVNGALSLTAEVRERAVGDKVSLTVIRGGKQITVSVTLAARPAGELTRPAGLSSRRSTAVRKRRGQGSGRLGRRRPGTTIAPYAATSAKAQKVCALRGVGAAPHLAAAAARRRPWSSVKPSGLADSRALPR